jgi:ribosome-associated toxin RatA of RatAB toxin-antitoxin module
MKLERRFIMLDLDIQLFTDEEQETTQVEGDTNDTTTTVETTTQPFKAFESEEEFSKFTQSISSKAKGEILKEIGGSNVNDIKSVYEKGKQFDDINEKYTTIKSEYETALTDKENLTADLIVTKYNIDDEYKDEFLTLAKAKISDDVDLQTASKQVFDKLGKNFTKTPNSIKIGGNKTTPIPPDIKKEMEDLRKL